MSPLGSLRRTYPLVVLSVVYASLIFRDIRRVLWYDELITFYIAKARTLPEVMHLMARWDLNPPTLHLVARFSMALFGQNAVGLRLPSVVEFYLASLMMFGYAQRKIGTEFGLVSVLLLWYSPFFQYATEARSYALLAMFFAALLFCWDAVVTEAAVNRKRARWAIAGANAGLIASHVFAPLALIPFWVAEAVRSVRRRKVDYGIAAALLLPALIVLAYIAFFHGYEALIYPSAFQAGPRKIAAFFWHAIPGAALKGAIGVAALLTLWRLMRAAPSFCGFRETDLIFYIVLLAEPALLNLILMWGHGAFWDRYCLTAALGLYILIAALFGLALQFHRVAGLFAAIALGSLLLAQRIPHPLYDNLTSAASASTSGAFAQLEPKLPLVAASGLTFVEMNYEESPALLSRLYYLTDTGAAVRLAHANLFESLGELKHDFGLEGTVEPYTHFLEHHRRFLVLGTENYPEDWLLRKLSIDQAQIVRVAECKLPYKDSAVYEVTVPARQ